jgi:hypothetical protein
MHILAASLCRCRAFTHLFLVARSRYCIFFTFQEIEAVLSFKSFFMKKFNPHSQSPDGQCSVAARIYYAKVY